jgi:hypothetical protein
MLKRREREERCRYASKLCVMTESRSDSERLTHLSNEAFGLAIYLGSVNDVAFVLLKHLYEFLAGFLGIKGAPRGDHCTTEGGLDAGAGHGSDGG